MYDERLKSYEVVVAQTRRDANLKPWTRFGPADMNHDVAKQFNRITLHPQLRRKSDLKWRWS